MDAKQTLNSDDDDGDPRIIQHFLIWFALIF